MANPTSAFLRAGASLVPSPVTATTFPLSLRPVTKQYLSYGLDLAKTSNLSLILSNSSALATVSTLTYCPSSAFDESIGQSQTWTLHLAQTIPPTSLLNYGPYMAKNSFYSETKPISLAMALAVMILSPVTILTMIPALWHSLMASGTYFLGISLTPTTAIKTKLSF